VLVDMTSLRSRWVGWKIMCHDLHTYHEYRRYLLQTEDLRFFMSTNRQRRWNMYWKLLLFPLMSGGYYTTMHGSINTIIQKLWNSS
jgi:hypothetical protein